ncbi:MAG: cob(I)yrinic acid a,c-diamide adenosyltransferase [Deltaproteobacteria bacterium]|jgi:cob(I)alamin adenosyltransferase|nr:cob(I)yrinic acid a,c-diamide adenosyltransferase [Deltaproteobacteria bacterium]MBW2511266.1 cob(I)yrinic acid a,c-diamide adenosyltransferase [Deltaproteobacteria bacterium]MDH4006564.1 cob(I)yrinic acid a,c-diamide adenosyltransferase [Desulfuromonadales bacterium]
MTIQLTPVKVNKLVPKKPHGLVVVITGNGKGKTTSAMGMVLRASGYGMKVCIIQFMKGDIYSGEWDGVKLLGERVELHTTGMGFCGIQGNPYSREEHRAAAQAAIDLAMGKIESGNYDIVILDEINNALKLKLVDLDQVLGLVRSKPELMHMVLTGRDAHPDLVEMADTVSEVCEIKHAYRKDIEPQPGIDY